VGIIGRNGAGKSTLLKTLSRITEPTHGYIDIVGRIGSLLEVGTGFHPELSGRENIYLNGAILGMKRAEIQKKFDEMVAFAEVEKFIDMPIKHYSSGMYLRLAFAVAAHLEPEILLVDEVLAVGDIAFQKKCLGKMDEVAKEGRTVLFVSHNMGTIRSLCNQGVTLQEGQIYDRGDVTQAVEAYYRSLGMLPDAETEATGAEQSHRYFGPILVNGTRGGTILQSQSFDVSTSLRVDQGVSGFSLFCILGYMDGGEIAIVRKDISVSRIREFSPGRCDVDVRFPSLWLSAGVYAVYFKASFWGDNSCGWQVSDKFTLDVEGDSSLTQALLQPEVSWHIGMAGRARAAPEEHCLMDR
jgi:lipopolysaccharide transport system ATP-binding protein